MTGHIDILDEPETLRRPFLSSLVLHVGVVSMLAFLSWWSNRGREAFGEPNATGGAVGVTVVNSIPMPNRVGPRNPVANESESQVPQPPPKKQAQQKQIEDKNAIALKSRKAPRKLSDVAASRQRYRPEDVDRPNQLYSTAGQAVASPLYAATGSGGVGTRPGSILGVRFGWYEQLVRQRVASAWHTAEIDARLRTAPIVIVTFDIMRDGSVRNLQTLQGSGISALDFSAQRAVLEAAPFPPLPAGYERNSAHCEFWFELKR